MRSAATPALAVILSLALALPAMAAKRVALVIGNSGYAASPLANPANDAKAMAAKLQSLGFTVIQHIDADLRTMDDAMESFYRRLQGAEAGLFYYAGHGMQTGGENYLIPVDADIRRERDLRYEALAAGRVLGAMEDAGAPVNIVILDACRDNPFKKSFRSGSRGLAVVQSVRGSFVAFATSPGSVAADGDDQNGVFTKHILATIDAPGLTVEDVFRKVRQGVVAETRGRQTPWDSSSLTGAFHFASQQAAPKASTATARPDAAQSAMAEELRNMRAEMEALRQARAQKDAAELAALKAEMERLKKQQASGGGSTQDNAQMDDLREELERLKAATAGSGQGLPQAALDAKYTVAFLPLNLNDVEGKISKVQAEALDEVQKAFARNPAYYPSYSGEELNMTGVAPLKESLVENHVNRYWSRGKPDVEAMAALGKELGVDAVLGMYIKMVWATPDDKYLTVLVDTRTGRAYMNKFVVRLWLPGGADKSRERLGKLLDTTMAEYDDAHASAEN